MGQLDVAVAVEVEEAERRGERARAVGGDVCGGGADPLLVGGEDGGQYQVHHHKEAEEEEGDEEESGAAAVLGVGGEHHVGVVGGGREDEQIEGGVGQRIEIVRGPQCSKSNTPPIDATTSNKTIRMRQSATAGMTEELGGGAAQRAAHRHEQQRAEQRVEEG